MSRRKNITKEDVEREYLMVRRNLDEAASALGCSKKTLLWHMDHLGIKSKSHAWNVSSRDLSSLARKQYIDKEIIQTEYLDIPVGMIVAAKKRRAKRKNFFINGVTSGGIRSRERMSSSFEPSHSVATLG